jgi:hypothetical protein
LGIAEPAGLVADAEVDVALVGLVDVLAGVNAE